jgi:hypothetical protein
VKYLPILGVLSLATACGPNAGGDGAGSGGDDASEEGGGSPVEAGGGGTVVDGAAPVEASAPTDAGHHDGGDAGHPHDAAAEAAPACGKHITVVFSVGTGAGSLASHTSACWSVVDADGAADKQWRKCSTSNFVVGNPSAPNWAFDDSNPNAPLSQDESFLQQCSAGSTGDGFEYLAYRGSWRLMYPATHLKAFFAELYTGDGAVDDLWSQPGVYSGNSQLAGHTVYPMINIGPTNPPSNVATVIENGALAMCKTVKDGGMLGVYVGTWNQPMPANDPRILALAKAVDSCTK